MGKPGALANEASFLCLMSNYLAYSLFNLNDIYYQHQLNNYKTQKREKMLKYQL